MSDRSGSIDKTQTAKDAVAANADNANAGTLPVWKRRELSTAYIDAVRKGHSVTGVDVPFLILTLVLLMAGVIMVLSASFARSFVTIGQPMYFFTRQLVFAISGVAIMLLVSRLHLRMISRWSMHLLVMSIALLVLVLNVGIVVNGARRWLGVGNGNNLATFQPSEIAKLALILSFAQMSCKFGSKMKTFKYGVLPFAVIFTIMAVLLWLEPHKSAAIIIIALAAVMMFAGGTHAKWFVLALAVVALLAGVVYFKYIRAPADVAAEGDVSLRQVVDDNSEFLGYAGNRISSWLDPEADPLNSGLQVRQSLFAVGSGGLFGQGLGQSRQKYMYLPEEHNDFIFAIVCEELGFIGALLILALYALLIIRGFWLAIHSGDKYGALITIGIMSLLSIQVFLNVAVVINLIPATGISLPFFSYGGTALWLQMTQMGIVLAVSKEKRAADVENEMDSD